MKLYFCGSNRFNLIFQNSDSFINEPRLVDSCLLNVQTVLDRIVFQKEEGCEFSWFIRGQGISDDLEIFSPDLKISQVCLTSNSLLGFSPSHNSLYKINFSILNYDDDQRLSWDMKKVVPSDPSIKFKELKTNSKNFYILDDKSCIYEILEGDEALNLKWRLENVEIVKFESGFGHFVALSDTGALYSWGSGGRGELGHLENDHVMVNCNVPKRIEFFDDLPCIVKNISCGGWHTLALTSSGDIYSWGWNDGQLGHSREKLSSVGGIPYPIDIGSGDDPVTQIACGGRHSFAVLKSGKLFGFGLNKWGQLGLGNMENKSEPTEITRKKFFCSKIVCDRWSTFIYT